MMMTRDEVIDLCVRHKACDEAMDWLRSQPAEATAEDLLAACKRGDWLLWLAPRIGIGDAQVYVRIACEIARSVRHLVPEDEDRPRRAIEIAERSLTEHVTRYELTAARDAARAAAGEAWAATNVEWAAGDAADAARAAAGAAAWAAWNAAGAARDAARAAAGAATWSARAARDAAGDAVKARAARDAALASHADIVRKHMPLEMWVDACSDQTKGNGK